MFTYEVTHVRRTLICIDLCGPLVGEPIISVYQRNGSLNRCGELTSAVREAGGFKPIVVVREAIMNSAHDLL